MGGNWSAMKLKTKSVKNGQAFRYYHCLEIFPGDFLNLQHVLQQYFIIRIVFKAGSCYMGCDIEQRHTSGGFITY
jgi:hypothetical protein